jgi:hypothetical protein
MEIALKVGQGMARAVFQPEDGILAVGLAERVDPLHKGFDGRSPVGVHSPASLPGSGLARRLPQPRVRLRREEEDARFRPGGGGAAI